MKSYVVLLLLVSTAAVAQTEYKFSNTIDWRRTFSEVAIPDSLQISTLARLSKLDNAPFQKLDDILPSEHDWKREVPFAGSYSRMMHRHRNVDNRGMALMRNFNRELIFDVFTGSMKFKF
ncbi:MAG TPA: hypothetical protein VFQ50_01485 [Flavobacterium sp.]|jgi:hypothetical protein|nr:hypothetical protein [Flavobacterium sp.]